MDEPLLIFVIDTSGSMCVSTEVQGTHDANSLPTRRAPVKHLLLLPRCCFCISPKGWVYLLLFFQLDRRAAGMERAGTDRVVRAAVLRVCHVCRACVCACVRAANGAQAAGYISRLDAIKAAVDRYLERLSVEHPGHKVRPHFARDFVGGPEPFSLCPPSSYFRTLSQGA